MELLKTHLPSCTVIGSSYQVKAPGRLDVIGGIADYNGSLVLEMPILEHNLVSLFTIENLPEIPSSIYIISQKENLERSSFFTFSVQQLQSLHSVSEAKNHFQHFHSKSKWVSYLLGCFVMIQLETQLSWSTVIPQNQSIVLVVDSTLPEGKGVASSASIEISTMYLLIQWIAFVQHSTPLLNNYEIALLCQKVENQIVGASCGIMDQMTSMFGKKDHLFCLECRPATILPSKKVPKDLLFVGLDSGVKHSITEGEYNTVRLASEMGKYIIDQMRDKPLNYLSELEPSEFCARYAHLLPNQISGATFLEEWPKCPFANDIILEAKYAILPCTRFPIEENFRAKMMMQCMECVEHASSTLSEDSKESIYNLMGEILNQSYAGYVQCSLHVPETDFMASLVKKYRSRGLLGCRISGGGRGGVMVILMKNQPEAKEALELLRNEYYKTIDSDPKIGLPQLFISSGEGAEQFGFKKC